jgi:hypothetical protein
MHTRRGRRLPGVACVPYSGPYKSEAKRQTFRATKPLVTVIWHVTFKLILARNYLGYARP